VTGRQRVFYYLRPPVKGVHSIERVFRTVAENLPEDLDAAVITLSSSARGLVGRLRALGEVLTQARGIHHVTGDVHFLVLALPWRRTVLTVHDLVRLKELRGFRRLLYRFFWFSLPVRLAAAVTVISDQTAMELLRDFPNVSSKLHVIYNPLPAHLGQVYHHPRVQRSRPMILHVGTNENKNLGLSITVAQRLGAELTILGILRPGQRTALDEAGIAYRTHHDVADESLAGVYIGAHLLLFPSFAEGFGMPIIEAQACGVPVVTSDREPMRTVAGGAALLIDPTDVDATVAAVRRLLVDEDLRRDLRAEGFENAKRFSSTAISAAYAAVYRSMVSPRNDA
jgi:glycosyltransferase involved in cell wall biosynthesis